MSGFIVLLTRFTFTLWSLKTSFFKITNMSLKDRIQTTSARISNRIIVVAILLFPFFFSRYAA